MHIYLIRHGLTELGEQQRYQGSLDTPLSANGRSSLRAAAFSPDLIAVSPLLRARETAELLFPGIRQKVCPDLREMAFGVFEGRSWREMEKDSDYRAWVESGCISRCPGGEDRKTFSLRTCRVFEALLQDAFTAGCGKLAVVAHGGTQMAVLEQWGRPEREYYRWQTACGHGWELEPETWPGELRVCGEADFTR